MLSPDNCVLPDNDLSHGESNGRVTRAVDQISLANQSLGSLPVMESLASTSMMVRR